MKLHIKTSSVLWALSAAAFFMSAVSCGVLPEEISANRNLDYSMQADESFVLEPDSSYSFSDSSQSSDSSSLADTSSDISSKTDSSSKKDTDDKNGGEETDPSEEQSIKNPYLTTDIGRPAYAVVPNDASVKYLGRTELSDDVLWCAMSGTGAEFEYTGRNLEVTFKGDSSVNDVYGHKARIGIFVNGERVVDEMITQSEQTFKVIKMEESASYNVKIIKLSEVEMSTVGIKSIDIDDGDGLSPSAQKSRKIEFIGDSITCGYGIDDPNPNSSFSTSTEDITKTFAHLTAEYFGADYSVFAMSGYGVLSGWTGDPSKINSSPVIPPYYSTLGCTDASFTGHSSPQGTSWDFGRFQPDAVVINLGTNDSTYCQDDEDKLSDFVNAYISFLKDVRACNPNAEIFCILGTCSKQIYPQVEQAVNGYTEETGDSRIHSFLIDSGNSSYGYGASYHPSEASHRLMADVLYDKMSGVMDW